MGLEPAFYDTRSNQGPFQNILSRIKSTNFIAWDALFFDIIGSQTKFEKIYSFEEEPPRVQEAPAFVLKTNELFYADTDVVGWLWAINAHTRKVRIS